jgi:hypothetical protein
MEVSYKLKDDVCSRVSRRSHIGEAQGSLLFLAFWVSSGDYYVGGIELRSRDEICLI